MLEDPVPPEDSASGKNAGAQPPTAPVEFIKALVTDSGWLEAQVVEASDVFVHYWAKHIQPVISNDRTRPDWNWDWLALFANRSAATRIASLLGQAQRTYCIIARDVEGLKFPIGMLHLVLRYRWVLDETKNSTFMWYLAAAPREIIQKRFGRRPRMMSAFIDVGLVVSMTHGNEGRIFLHADPIGGENLEASYTRCGMMKAASDASISVARKIMANRSERKTGTAGAYFYVDESNARRLLNLSDRLRSYSAGGR